MPSGSEGVLRGGRVKLVVHKAIPTKGRDADVVSNDLRCGLFVMVRDVCGW